MYHTPNVKKKSVFKRLKKKKKNLQNPKKRSAKCPVSAMSGEEASYFVTMESCKPSSFVVLLVELKLPESDILWYKSLMRMSAGVRSLGKEQYTKQKKGKKRRKQKIKQQQQQQQLQQQKCHHQQKSYLICSNDHMY